jgi:stage II sporulation protein AA (anti-sigma F factor antagonist)
MNIEISSKGRNLIVQISGDIDHHTVEEIKAKIEKEFTRTNCKNLIFDFTNLEFMDSSGIGMIIGRYKVIEKKGGQVVVSSINENPKRLIKLSGLDKILKCYDTVESALSSLE